jgi:hypothetical protein
MAPHRIWALPCAWGCWAGSAGLTAATVAASAVLAPKAIVPARIIPAGVSQTMQAALAARQQKLQQLTQGK